MANRGGQLSFEITASVKRSTLCTICNIPRRTLTRDLHMALKIPYLHDFIIKVCREQVAIILNHENVNIRISQGEARHIKYKSFKLGGGQPYYLVCGCILQQYLNFSTVCGTKHGLQA
jgi:hypothetical protein